jgi:hypothetical protein
MYVISQEPVPDEALLKTYRGGTHPERWSGYGDCFAVTVDQTVGLAEFVYCFYTSPVFRIERGILTFLAGAPSRDEDARAVADGSGRTFAIWRVGERTPTQLLMCDRYERTRSWFRVVPMEGGSTRLQFGSAVAVRHEQHTVTSQRSGSPGVLLRFHLLYSRILLHCAKKRVIQRAEHG